jgi:hypothetical protein
MKSANLVLALAHIGFAAALCEMVVAPAARAQEAAQQGSGATLQEKAQNPIADLITVPVQFNVNGNVGQLDRTQMVLNLQPVLPIELGPHWNLIVRPILPIIANPVLVSGGDGAFGLGDLNPQLFISPSGSTATSFGDVTWGLGPAFSFPTATDGALGSEKWSAAPAGVVFVLERPWSYGALLQNYWSFAGNDDREDVNQLVLQPFVNYNLPDGWAVGTAPIVTADWEAADRRWTLPVGGGVSKLTRVGKLPVNFIVRGYYNALSPVNGPDWQMQAQVNFLFPK